MRKKEDGEAFLPIEDGVPCRSVSEVSYVSWGKERSQAGAFVLAAILGLLFVVFVFKCWKIHPTQVFYESVQAGNGGDEQGM